jgi:hypothetical protein
MHPETAAGKVELQMPLAEFSRLLHDMNGALGIIVGNLDMLLETPMTGDAEVRSMLEDALQAAMHVCAHTSNLQAARPGKN